MHCHRIAAAAVLAALAAACSPQSRADAAAAPNLLVAQKGVGAKFGSRDPYKCSATTAPKTGPMIAAIARQYIICANDHINDIGWLFLAENVHVQVGKGVPYADSGMGVQLSSDVDPSAKVYALRGSFDSYMCRPLSDFGGKPGSNCTVDHETKATGHCYRTTFGDWNCNIMQVGAPSVENQPAPTK